MAQPNRATRLAVCFFAVAMGPALTVRAAPETQPAKLEPKADAAAVAKPDPQPEPPKVEDAIIRSQRSQRDSARNQFAHLKELGTMKRDELLQLSLSQGLLKLEVTSQATVESQRVKVEGSSAVWAVSKQPPPTIVGNAAINAARLNQGPTHILQRVDPDVKDDNEVWSLYISGNNNYITMMGTRVNGRVTLHQTGNSISATVMEWQQGGRLQSVFTGKAPSIQQFRSDHPDEFRKYFQPMLMKLSDLAWLRPGSADVYAAFASIQADMKIAQRLEALLPDLDSPAFPVRDSASTRLEALGPAGVLAALRADASNLTDEQRGRLAAFIRQNRNRSFEDPAAARKDVNFLIDALEYEDPAVRTAAREQLGQIFGHAVKFDVSLSGDRLTTAIDDLRKEAAALSAASAQPTTKPAS